MAHVRNRVPASTLITSVVTPRYATLHGGASLFKRGFMTHSTPEQIQQHVRSFMIGDLPPDRDEQDTKSYGQPWRIYGIHGLPAQITAALFSRFSRTHLSAEQLLSTEFWPEIQDIPVPRKASANGYSHEFFDRVLGAYGDESVAEMGTLDIVLEGIPIWLAMLVQNARFGFSCIEKSTRYVPIINRAELVTSTQFDEINQDMIERQRMLCNDLQNALHKQLIKPADVSKAAWERTLQAHALDCTRGLLPLGTATNVAVHANARAWADIICDLLAYGRVMGDPNATKLGEMIQQVCLTMAPALFRDFVDGKGKERLAIKIQALEPEMKAHAWDEQYEVEPCAFYVSRQSQADLWAKGGPVRPTRHTKVPRDTAHSSTMTMQAVCSIAAYRDMRRGRRLAWSEPATSREGLLNIEEHPILAQLGWGAARIGQEYIHLLHDVATMTIGEDTKDWEQWYNLPLATPCRFTVTGDLPAWSWLCELRSSQQGHYEYRALAQAMAKVYMNEYPNAVERAFQHVDYSPSGLARLAAEHKKDH